MNQVLAIAVSVLALSTVAATIASKNITQPPLGAPPVEFVERKQVEQYLSRSLYSAVMSVDRYLSTLYREGRFDYPGDGVDLTDTIFPHYGFLPAKRFTFHWRVMTGQLEGQKAVYLCAYPTSAPVRNTTEDAITWLYHVLPREITQLSAACGTRTTGQESSANHISYWLFWPTEAEVPAPVLPAPNPEPDEPGDPAPTPEPEPTPTPPAPTPPDSDPRPPGLQEKPLPPGLENKPLPPGWTKPLPPGWTKSPSSNGLPPGQAKKQK